MSSSTSFRDGRYADRLEGANERFTDGCCPRVMWGPHTNIRV
jgi:hypothetical protein